jgi:prepilin-type N-terminal cleavage/methylation domain-containing protein
MRPGVTLLELVAALAIASIMSVMLYQGLNQSYKAVRTIDVLVDAHSELALFFDRFYKDISGAFVPVQAISAQEKGRKEIEEKGAQAGKPQESKIDAAKSSEAGKVEGEEKQKPLKDIFVLEEMKISGEARASRSSFTFITANPLTIYGEAIPRIVRVLYVVEADKKKSGLWNLVRYESTELDNAVFKDKQSKGAIKGYAVLHNIEKFTIECSAFKEVKQEGKESTQEKKTQDKKEPEKKELERFSKWNDQQRLKDKQNLIPSSVEIKGVIREFKKEVDFNLVIPIFAYQNPPPAQEAATFEKRMEEIMEKIKNPESAKRKQEPTGEHGIS